MLYEFFRVSVYVYSIYMYRIRGTADEQYPIQAFFKQYPILLFWI